MPVTGYQAYGEKVAGLTCCTYVVVGGRGALQGHPMASVNEGSRESIAGRQIFKYLEKDFGREEGQRGT